jgi:uncharacterized membrane protein
MVIIKNMEKNNSDLGLTTKRIEGLTDGIFAIAMTLLVLNLSLPKKGIDLTEAGLHQMLFGQLNHFFNYFLSFVLLAVFWILHHQQFHFIKRTNRTHLWINIFILMFVALVPFSTSLVGDFPYFWLDDFFFASNMFVLGVLFYLNWIYSTSGHRLVESDLDKRRIALGNKRALVLPVVSFLAMGTSLISPSLSSYLFLCIPLILLLRTFRNI